MLNFAIKTDNVTGEQYLETNLTGKLLLTTPQLNKSTAFSASEREALGLVGKLPIAVETIDEQAKRAYRQYGSFHTLMQKNVYLRMLHETNETLFFKVLQDNIGEMLPVLYTPIVGTAVQHYSYEFRRPRGLYISYPDRDRILDIIENRTHPGVSLLVVTDGEGVLGIGDQGIGAMDIPIAKLMVYSVTAGICPTSAIPVMLDVGTNNQKLLDDPMYLGWRHKRIEGAEYDAFITKFVDAIQQAFPDVYLHWEDFGRRNGHYNLEHYRHKICSFNDDIQGTGVVTLAALMAAINASGTDIIQQKVVVYGAGSAGLGITQQLHAAMVRAGLSPEEATSRFWLLTSQGLYTDKSVNRTSEREPYSRRVDDISQWQTVEPNRIGLYDVVKNVKPTILIGTSTQTDAFTESVVKEMAKHTERPIIFPLSNPTERSEAQPKDLVDWTEGKALIASGSPFAPVPFRQHQIPIAQCNNALVFPGIGLGVIAIKAKRLTDDMLWAAVQATSNNAPIRRDPLAALLPSIENCAHLSHQIAIAVAEQAIKEGVAQVPDDANATALVKASTWEPAYLPYRLMKE